MIFARSKDLHAQKNSQLSEHKLDTALDSELLKRADVA